MAAFTSSAVSTTTNTSVVWDAQSQIYVHKNTQNYAAAGQKLHKKVEEGLEEQKMANFGTFTAPGMFDAPFPCKRCRTTHYSMTVCDGWTKDVIKHVDLPAFLEKHLGHPAEWTEMVIEESKRLASLRFAAAGHAWEGKTGDPIRFWNEPVPWEISGGGYVDAWEVWINFNPK